MIIVSLSLPLTLAVVLASVSLAVFAFCRFVQIYPELIARLNHRDPNNARPRY